MQEFKKIMKKFFCLKTFLTKTMNENETLQFRADTKCLFSSHIKGSLKSISRDPIAKYMNR